MFEGVAEVVYFVDHPAEAAGWYARLLRVAVKISPPRVSLGGVELTFHAADEESPGGPAGQVAYFFVQDFAAACARLEEAGASVYRGPLQRPDDKTMVQYRDPFANVVGILGPGRPS